MKLPNLSVAPAFRACVVAVRAQDREVGKGGAGGRRKEREERAVTYFPYNCVLLFLFSLNYYVFGVCAWVGSPVDNFVESFFNFFFY